VEVLKDRKRFVILSSPPDSGKSTVLKMMISQRPVDAVFKYVPIESHLATGFDELEKAGLKRTNSGWEWTGPEDNNEPIVIMIDDAHLIFGNESFWRALIKGEFMIPRNIRFIIAANHLMHGNEYPMIALFCDLSRIHTPDFLLTEEEQIVFLNHNEFGLAPKFRNFNCLKGIMMMESKGLIGALCISVEILNNCFKNHPEVTEDQAINLYSSSTVIGNYGRCFGCIFDEQWDEAATKMITDMYCDKPLTVSIAIYPGEAIANLIKCGILRWGDLGISFSSPLAKRYFKIFFPHVKTLKNLILRSLLEEI
jgi:hypothetical protein